MQLITVSVQFQLTASRRGWRLRWHRKEGVMEFQLTASRRGWPKSQPWSQIWRHFNSQPHEEADLTRYGVYKTCSCISTHSLTKRLTGFLKIFIKIRLFQLTASRRGWHRLLELRYCQKNISTHSLTKRLTSCDRIHFVFVNVFQLTASRRGWLTASKLCRRSIIYFNSQPHEEADGAGQFRECKAYRISTHSLTKRLTSYMLRAFNDVIFQLTASRRGWSISCYSLSSYTCISTHSLTKRLTWDASDRGKCTDISTHSLTKRLTGRRWCRNGDLRPISTHSLTKRLTYLKLFYSTCFIFQLTASLRGWRLVIILAITIPYFNSQPHEEADGDLAVAINTHRSISTHSLTKRLTTMLFWFLHLYQIFQLTASRRGWRQF